MLSAALGALRRSRRPPPAIAAGEIVTRAPSMVVPLLFRGFDKLDGLSVLDLGAASSAKVAFFSNRKCRIEFVDLLNELDPALLSADAEDSDLCSALGPLLAGQAERTVDIILCWDVLNFLPLPALAIFHDLLSPQLQPNARLHCFGVRHSDTPIPWSEHAFDTDDCITTRAKDGAPWPSYAHTPLELNKHLASLQVARTILLQDARLELLLMPKTSAVELER